MRAPESTIKLNSKMSFSNISIDETFLVMLADEFFYLFAGKQIGINLLDMVHADYQEEFREACRNLSLGESRRLVTMLHDFRGDYHLVDVIIENQGNTLENEPVLQLHLYNITSIENAHIQFLNELNKYRSFLSVYHDFLFDYDAETGSFCIFIYLGSKSTPYIKCNIEDFYKLAEDTYKSEEDLADFKEFYRQVKGAKDDFNCKLNMPFIDNNSEDNYCQITAKVIYKMNKNPYVVGVIRPINAQEQNSAPYYSTEEGRDPATRLLNKRACQEYTKDILKFHDGTKHYMIIIDIDNFKDINDIYGHLFGDEVILKVANIISTFLNGRGICGRFGGDEFYIFTTGINDEETLRTVLTAMRKELLYAYEGVIPDFRVTLSIGVSLTPDDGSTYEELFKKSDKCLYIAKNKGKNRFIIYDEAKHGAVEENAKALRNAFNPLEKAEFLGSFVGDAIIKLFAKAPEIDMDVLNEICSNFELDGIRIYAGDEPKLLCHTNTYKKLPEVEPYLNDESFVKKFNSNNALIVGNMSSLECIHKDLTAATLACSIVSMAIFRLPLKNGSYVTFFYDIFNHAIRWSESDKNYLLTISKILLSIIDP